MKDFPIQWTICSGAILILRSFIAWKRSYVLIGPYGADIDEFCNITQMVQFFLYIIQSSGEA